LNPLTGTLDPLGALQLRLTWCGSPVPVRPIVTVEFVEELLLTVSVPLAEPVAVGSNVSVTLSAWPGFSVAGRLTADAENPPPETATELTVTGAVPVEDSVTVCVVALFTTTAPNAILLAFTLKVGVAAFNCSDTVRDELPDPAVSVTDCAVVTADTLAVKDALVEDAGTVMEGGTVTAPSLLTRLTLRPPVGAEPDRLTVHESESEPVIDVLPQLTPLTVGATEVPVPLRFTGEVDALLETVSWPLMELALFGAN